MSDANPYVAATVVELDKLATTEHNASGTRWRLIPAILCYVVGAIGCGLGLFVLVSLIRYVTQPSEFPLVQSQFTLVAILVVLMYVGFGIAYLIAGRLFWRRRYYLAMLLCIAGILICAAGQFITDFLMHVGLSGMRI